MSEWGRDTTASRVDRLERENRRLKQAGGALLVALAAVGLIGQADPAASPRAAKVVEAQKFLLRDANGTSRAELAVLADGSPTLGLLDTEGRPRALLGLSPEGSPALAMLDQGERPRLTLSVRADGVPAVDLTDANGRLRARLDLAVDGLPGLAFFNQDGKPRAVMGVMGDGQLFVFPGGQ